MSRISKISLLTGIMGGGVPGVSWLTYDQFSSKLEMDRNEILKKAYNAKPYCNTKKKKLMWKAFRRRNIKCRKTSDYF